MCFSSFLSIIIGGACPGLAIFQQQAAMRCLFNIAKAVPLQQLHNKRSARFLV